MSADAITENNVAGENPNPEISPTETLSATNKDNGKTPPIEDPLSKVVPSPRVTLTCRDDLNAVLAKHQQWYQSVIDPRASLQWGLRANLSQQDLSGWNLEGLDLRGADLSGAKLDGCLMQGINLAGAKLAGASLVGADLYRANLSRANLTTTVLKKANLKESNLKDALMERTDLEEAHTDGANFTGARQILVKR